MITLTEKSLMARLNRLKAVECLQHSYNKNLPFLVLYHDYLDVKKAYMENLYATKEKYYSALRRLQRQYRIESIDDLIYYLCIKNCHIEDLYQLNLSHKNIQKIIIMYEKYNTLFNRIIQNILLYRLIKWKNLMEDEMSYRFSKNIKFTDEKRLLFKKVKNTQGQYMYKMQFLFEFFDKKIMIEDDETFFYNDKENPANVYIFAGDNNNIFIRIKEYYKIA